MNTIPPISPSWYTHLPTSTRKKPKPIVNLDAYEHEVKSKVDATIHRHDIKPVVSTNVYRHEIVQHHSTVREDVTGHKGTQPDKKTVEQLF